MHILDTMYGYTAEEIKEFIIFGKANNFSPGLRPIPFGSMGMYYRATMEGNIEAVKIEPIEPLYEGD